MELSAVKGVKRKALYTNLTRSSTVMKLLSERRRRRRLDSDSRTRQTKPPPSSNHADRRADVGETCGWVRLADVCLVRGVHCRAVSDVRASSPEQFAFSPPSSPPDETCRMVHAIVCQVVACSAVQCNAKFSAAHAPCPPVLFARRNLQSSAFAGLLCHLLVLALLFGDVCNAGEQICNRSRTLPASCKKTQPAAPVLMAWRFYRSIWWPKNAPSTACGSWVARCSVALKWCARILPRQQHQMLASPAGA